MSHAAVRPPQAADTGRSPGTTSGSSTASPPIAGPHDGPPDGPPVTTVLDAADVGRALTRIGHEILERNRGHEQLVLLGIPTRGVGLARRLSDRIREVEGASIPTGSLDITMYRDDVGRRPGRVPEPTDIPLSGIEDRTVVLVDDVLFSGRTIRAALDALGDLGRPRAVQLAVLVDRGHRELPIRADYVGKNLPTSLVQTVRVRLAEYDGPEAGDGVDIVAGGTGSPEGGVR